MNAKLILVGLIGLAVFALPQVGHGQNWTYGSSCFSPCWGNLYPTTYGNDSAPYFALHPPVYYSYRVARTYGYSPFPYPPGVLTPGSEPPRPVTVQNVYAASEGGEWSDSQQGRQPLRINNPFVEQSGRSGVTKDHRKSSVRQPQIVYPAAMAQRTK